MAFNPELGPPNPPTGPLRVAIDAEDPLVRGAIARMVEAAALAIAGDVAEADLVLVDGGPDATRGSARLDALAALERPAVVLVADADHAATALSAGAAGVVAREAGPERIAAALLAAHRGLVVLDGALAPRLLPPRARPRSRTEPEPLTPRELEVLELMAAGLSNRRIARALGITENTAKFHVNAVLGKLDARSRTEAVVLAARKGLVAL